MIDKKKNVAYFSAEFGIDSDLPTYSGGLGILAGDYMNACADMDLKVIGIGILYKGKSFIQHITKEGREEQRDSEFDHDTSFLRQSSLNGKPLSFDLDLGEYEVIVKPYHIRLSDNTTLYFLSTDVDGNPPEWISDMDALYKGDDNSQIRQEILLGVGGVKLIKKLKFNPDIYHINEGRPAFLIWELTKNLMEEKKLDFSKAWDYAKSLIVYTNHTLVKAGNPEYEVEKVSGWAKLFSKKMGVNYQALIEGGINSLSHFDLTKFALSCSSKQSSVSKVHNDYSKKEWSEYNFSTITNGVHIPRWQDSDFRNSNLSDEHLWELHLAKKRELVKSVKKRTGFEYDPEKLVVVWARRLAEYKQPKIIFSDVEKLKSIINTTPRGVQILYAGNSHSGDTRAKTIIEDIIKLFSSELKGYAIFIPNYNISLANHLTSGSDIWLNTPKGNLEACGTSGMKAISNGVLNMTVLDGWTYEVNWEGIGWCLNPNSVADDFYSKLEKEVIPLYNDRDQNNLPVKWIDRMRKSIDLSKNFSAEAMVKNYFEILY